MEIKEIDFVNGVLRVNVITTYCSIILSAYEKDGRLYIERQRGIRFNDSAWERLVHVITGIWCRCSRENGGE